MGEPGELEDVRRPLEPGEVGGEEGLVGARRRLPGVDGLVVFGLARGRAGRSLAGAAGDGESRRGRERRRVRSMGVWSWASLLPGSRPGWLIIRNNAELVTRRGFGYPEKKDIACERHRSVRPGVARAWPSASRPSRPPLPPEPRLPRRTTLPGPEGEGHPEPQLSPRPGLPHRRLERLVVGPRSRPSYRVRINQTEYPI
jgi:hypothetical protein